MKRKDYPIHSDSKNCKCLYCSVERHDPLFEGLMNKESCGPYNFGMQDRQRCDVPIFDSWIQPVLKNRSVVCYLNNAPIEKYKYEHVGIDDALAKFRDKYNYGHCLPIPYIPQCVLESSDTWDDCLNDKREYFDTTTEVKLHRYYSIVNNTIHSDRKPAIISYDLHGKVIYYCWVKLGKKHRLNGPAESYQGWNTYYFNGALALDDNLLDTSNLLDVSNRLDESEILSEYFNFQNQLNIAEIDING